MTKNIPPNIYQEWQDLVYKIDLYNQSYYQKDISLVSDQVYDGLKSRIEAIEEQFPVLKKEHTLNQVGYAPDARFKKVRHLFALHSLDNAFNAEELSHFLKKVSRFLSDDTELEYTAEPKIDGLSLVLRYENGALIEAATRGDGLEGESVLHHCPFIEGIPLTLLGKDRGICEIKGEVFIEKKDFQSLNQMRHEQNLPLFANARNAASGSLRQLETEHTKERKLKYIPHGLSLLNPAADIKTYIDERDLLKKWGFNTQPLTKVCKNLKEMLFYYEDLAHHRESLSYEIDGVVFKINTIALQKRLGYSAKAPRFAIAQKFESPLCITTLEKIDIQVGRTGILTPVAHLTPVFLGGVTITRASLHNEDDLLKKDIREGDLVYVERAGDVIPRVVSAVENQAHRGPPFEFPTHCPSCQTKTVRIKGQAAIRCPNSTNCTEQKLWQIRHFVSRNALNVEGLGEKNLRFFIKTGYIQNIQDIFNLKQHKSELEKLKGFGKKSTQNLIQSIEQSKKTTLDTFIYALGIPQVGEVTASFIADFCHHDKEIFKSMIQHILNQDQNIQEQLENIEGIGPVIAKEIKNFIQKESHLIHEILSYLSIQKNTIEKNTEHPLFGKHIVFTGALQTMTRQEAKKWADTFGAFIEQNVNQKTDFIIIGDKPGSKLKKAQELNILIMQESEFLQFIKEALSEQ